MRSTTLHTRDWEELAELDPLWAILSDPEKRFGKWELEDFFRTGEEEIASLMTQAERMQLPRQRQRAIDFGCGVGRLTRALRSYFVACHGVDISSSMLETARGLNPDCDFRRGHDLQSFSDGSADLIYSRLVLQHQPDAQSVARIIADMLRVLAPEGLLIFQMPVHLPWRRQLQPRRRLYRTLRAIGLPHTFLYQRLKLNPIRMIAMPQENVEGVVRRAGGILVSVELDQESHMGITNGTYCCSKTLAEITRKTDPERCSSSPGA
jgi:SAM-dependent methyltransferase